MKMEIGGNIQNFTNVTNFDKIQQKSFQFYKTLNDFAWSLNERQQDKWSYSSFRRQEKNEGMLLKHEKAIKKYYPFSVTLPVSGIIWSKNNWSKIETTHLKFTMQLILQC